MSGITIDHSNGFFCPFACQCFLPFIIGDDNGAIANGRFGKYNFQKFFNGIAAVWCSITGGRVATSETANKIRHVEGKAGYL
ncbi:hypothetical protein [uncultured Bartonella sp.]|uniref:hypothetical protein n=1 Tax=uncultured Bartonella sp. TaxID=104108 RepID=UPI00261FC160|nr:hypothetical protein [uncultured Bartonella sp.]